MIQSLLWGWRQILSKVDRLSSCDRTSRQTTGLNRRNRPRDAEEGVAQQFCGADSSEPVAKARGCVVGQGRKGLDIARQVVALAIV